MKKQCRFSRLPADVFLLPCLQEIDFSCNRIEEIPADLSEYDPPPLLLSSSPPLLRSSPLSLLLSPLSPPSSPLLSPLSHSPPPHLLLSSSPAARPTQVALQAADEQQRDRADAAGAGETAKTDGAEAGGRK
eukprot:749768-Hanusia_phi.AAC.1